MICAMSQAHTEILDSGEYAQFKAEFIHRDGMPYCLRCECCHDYDGQPPYCDTPRRYWAWRRSQQEFTPKLRQKA